jgi:hypothetical protein
MTEAENSSVTSGNLYRTTWCCMPEEISLLLCGMIKSVNGIIKEEMCAT